MIPNFNTMVSKTRLYDAFGELIYSIAVADGIVDPEEVEALHKILAGHPWAKEIEWSFNYELAKGNSLKDTYLKALETLKENGPHPDFAYLIEVLEEVAKAKDGINSKEGRMISIFQKSLRAHFLEYLDQHGLWSND